MINEKIDKLIKKLKATADDLDELSTYRVVREAMEKISKASFELKQLKSDIEAEKAIERCSVRRLAINDEIGDCGTDENGKCVGYESCGEPCDECKECVYGCAFEEE